MAPLNILDILMGQKIQILSNNFLLASHACFFTIFQLLPDFGSGPSSRFMGCLKYGFDSLAKSKLILKATETAKETDNDYFFFKILIGLCSTQLNKYLFERFIVQSREPNSQFRNFAMALSLIIFASNIFDIKFLSSPEFLAANSLILFMGYWFDTNSEPKKVKSSRKPGQTKLRSNAKA